MLEEDCYYAAEAVGAKLGDIAQIAQVRAVQFDDGPERATRAIDVRMAGGIHAMVLTDRGMDLGPVWFEGHPLGWISGTGPVHPAYGNDENWLRLYHGGLMVTAGFENIGLPSEDEDGHHGLHGRASMIPARNVHWKSVPDRPGAVEVVGTLREVSVHGTDLELTRTYRFEPGRAAFSIHDELSNKGFIEAPLLLLYHFNIGFPIVDEGARLIAPSHDAIAFDAASEASLARHMCIDGPRADAAVEVFEIVPHETTDIRTTIGVANAGFSPTDGIALAISYRRDQLPRLWQWRMLGQGRYLVGLEPATAGLRGRVVEQKNDPICMLQPGETRSFDLDVRVLTGDEARALAS